MDISKYGWLIPLPFTTPLFFSNLGASLQTLFSVNSYQICMHVRMFLNIFICLFYIGYMEKFYDLQVTIISCLFSSFGWVPNMDNEEKWDKESLSLLIHLFFQRETLRWALWLSLSRSSLKQVSAADGPFFHLICSVKPFPLTVMLSSLESILFSPILFWGFGKSKHSEINPHSVFYLSFSLSFSFSHTVTSFLLPVRSDCPALPPPPPTGM